MADLRIDVAAEFSGKRAFKEAAQATTGLDKAVGKLGKQLAGVFAATKVIQFGKASVKAFMEDERSATQLATAVKNLGLAFAQPEIDHYISKLEASAGIVDDKLRPSLQALLTTTGSLTKSQELLGLAIEGSRGSGIDLATVATDLAQAYVGNTRGLRKYNLGLTQAQLKTSSFADIQKKFQQQFSGANQAYIATYAGKLDMLTVASDNAKEAIGKGLVDALVLAGGKDGDVQDVADSMENLSNFTADAIRGVGVLAGKLADLDKNRAGGFFSTLLKAMGKASGIGVLANLGNASQPRPRANRNFTGGSGGGFTYDAQAAAEKKFREQQAKLAKQQAAAQKALTAEQKKQAALKKQGTLFDLEQIGIIAALKGNISKEERLRLELQLALITGNEDQATKLSKQLANSIDATGKLATYLTTLPDANNPFKAWDSWLATFKANLAGISGVSIPGVAGISNIPATNLPAGGISASVSTPSGSVAANSNPIQVYVNGSVISENDLVSAIEAGLQKSSLSGSPSSIGRVLGMFD